MASGGLTLLPTLLLAGAGASCVATGLLVGYGMHATEGDSAVRLEPDLSFPAVTATIGVTLALVGVAAGGEAFFWPGVGLVALGVAGVVRELLAARTWRRADDRP